MKTELNYPFKKVITTHINIKEIATLLSGKPLYFAVDEGVYVKLRFKHEEDENGKHDS